MKYERFFAQNANSMKQLARHSVTDEWAAGLLLMSMYMNKI